MINKILVLFFGLLLTSILFYFLIRWILKVNKLIKFKNKSSMFHFNIINFTTIVNCCITIPLLILSGSTITGIISLTKQEDNLWTISVWMNVALLIIDIIILLLIPIFENCTIAVVVDGYLILTNALINISNLNKIRTNKDKHPTLIVLNYNNTDQQLDKTQLFYSKQMWEFLNMFKLEDKKMVKQAKFIKSAANRDGWINDQIPEIMFVGRSNVGKSSFINALTNQNKLAKVANTPGKTRLLNFFEINNGYFRIVDAPGYGYAKISNNMKIAFGEMMEEYLTERENLGAICQLVDLRHPPSKDDKWMYGYLKSIGIPVFMIGTKLDKLKRNDIQKNIKIIKAELKFNNEDFFLPVSNIDRTTLSSAFEMIEIVLGLKQKGEIWEQKYKEEKNQ